MDVSSPLVASDLDVERIGSGPRVVLVHGSIVGARVTWRKQHTLGSSWTLVMPNRPGFGDSPPLERGDFDVEAELIADVLVEDGGAGAHLIGHSYGAVIALLAAARHPSRVRALIVSEPGLLRLAAGDPTADAMITSGERLYRLGPDLPPAEFLRMFRGGVHSSHETPDTLPPELQRGVMVTARERPSWHAEVPFDRLASATFPKLVISGGHSPVFETVCDVVAERSGARRMTISGRGHTIPATGDAYNQVVDAFLTEVSGHPHATLDPTSGSGR